MCIKVKETAYSKIVLEDNSFSDVSDHGKVKTGQALLFVPMEMDREGGGGKSEDAAVIATKTGPRIIE